MDFDRSREDEMGERKQVERETVFEAEPERVWEALTDDALLSDWFAEEAAIDPVEGGEVSFEFEDGARHGTVQEVDPERHLAFTWARPGEGESMVTFTIEPVERGTRLLVVERSLAGPQALVFAGPSLGRRLVKLELCLGALVFA